MKLVDEVISVCIHYPYHSVCLTQSKNLRSAVFRYYFSHGWKVSHFMKHEVQDPVHYYVLEK